MASKAKLDTEAIRAKLDALGERREEQDAAEDELATDTKEALALAEADPAISTTEAAKRLKLHRTTLYRVYCK